MALLDARRAWMRAHTSGEVPKVLQVRYSGAAGVDGCSARIVPARVRHRPALRIPAPQPLVALVARRGPVLESQPTSILPGTNRCPAGHVCGASTPLRYDYCRRLEGDSRPSKKENRLARTNRPGLHLLDDLPQPPHLRIDLLGAQHRRRMITNQLLGTAHDRRGRDRVFREAMNDLKVAALRRWIMWAAVVTSFTYHVLGWPRARIERLTKHVFQTTTGAQAAIITLTQPLGRPGTVWAVASVIQS
jgi:hypothetical protein